MPSNQYIYTSSFQVRYITLALFLVIYITLALLSRSYPFSTYLKIIIIIKITILIKLCQIDKKLILHEKYIHIIITRNYLSKLEYQKRRN